MLALFLFLLQALPALARPAVDVPSVDTAQVRIDGALDEDVWSQLEPITEFLRYQPSDGGPPAGSTEIRMFHDERNLYVGIKVRDAPQRIRARVSARERINADDQIGIYLDPFDEGGSGYIFYINAIGIQQDLRVLPGNFNPSWDTVYRSRGRLVGNHGYDLEIALPFRSIKYPNTTGPQGWSLILTRKIPGEGAKYGFPRIERNVPRVFSQGAAMTIDPPDSGSGLEIRPELAVVGQARRDSAEMPFEWGSQGNGALRPGLDVKYGLTPNLGLGATVNPDFSQVENDETPINVNQRFAFFFSERRPFFLDGSGYFANRSNSLYSRSIINPLYGLKLTGREGGVAMGVLHALDRSPGASVHQYGAPGFSEEDVQGAMALNTVGRVAVDVLQGGHVGMTVTDKRLMGSDGLRGVNDTVNSQLFTPIGARWTFGIQSLHTWTGEDQGPKMYGHLGAMELKRQAARGLGTSIWTVQSTPGVRQETGFRTQTGRVEGGSSVGWTFEPGGLVDTLTPRVMAMAVEEDEGDRFRMVETSAKAVIAGVYEAEVEAGISEFVEQGFEVPGRWLSFNVEGDATRWLSLDARIRASRTIDFATLAQASRSGGSLETTLRPTAGIRVDTIVRVDRIAPLGFDPRFATSIRSRLTWQFTQQLGLRLVEQHVMDSEDEPVLTSSLLFTWLRNPGTAVYLGYAETTVFGDKPQTMNRTVFAKGTVLFRL